MESPKANLRFSLFIVLFVLYFAQGFLYPSGSIISQSLLLIIILWGLIGLAHQLFVRQKPLITSAMIIFTLMLAVTYLLSPKIVYGWRWEAIGQVTTFNQFKAALTFCLCYFIGLNVGEKTSVSTRQWLIAGVILCLLTVQTFVYTRAALTAVRQTKETTINIAYQFIALLPIVALLLKKHRVVAMCIFICIVFFVIWGAKRGAIVCLVLSSVFMLYVSIRYLKLSGFQRVAAILFVVGIALFAVSRYTQNEYLQDRLHKTQTQGVGNREIAYKILFDHWIKDDDMTHKILGNGTAQTITVWGNYAHNDWLELLIDNGLLGVTIYALLLISVIVFIRKRVKDKFLQLAAGIAVLCWFLKTIFSMGYTDAYYGLSMFIIGYIIQITMRCSSANGYFTNKLHSEKVIIYRK